MRHFFTILRDSYREAVDGFLIYIMVGLATIVLLMIASISFKPQDELSTFSTLNEDLSTFIPDKGKSKVFAVSYGTKYQISDVRKQGNNVDLKLSVRKDKQFNGDFKLPEGSKFQIPSDPLRLAVAAWHRKPAVEKLTLPIDAKNRPGALLSFAESMQPNATEEDAAKVTDEQILDYIRGQFRSVYDMKATKVEMSKSNKAPDYDFDVEIEDPKSSVAWPHEVSVFFGAFTLPKKYRLGNALFGIQDSVVNGIGAGATLLISVVITSFFIPNMIRKGAFDLLIAKPISRVSALVYKYIGGLFFILILTTYTVGGSWVILGLRSGHWDMRFLIVIPMLTFTFALLYAFSTLIGVLTRSAIASMLLTFMLMVVLFIVGYAKTFADVMRNTDAKSELPDWAYTVVDGLNYSLPRYKDIDNITSKIISEGNLTSMQVALNSIVLGETSFFWTMIQSIIYIVVMLALASWRVATRDG